MRKFSRLRKNLLSPLSALLAVVSALLSILAFPDFELSALAWFALVPLLAAVEREKDSGVRSFLTGWAYGVVFFFGSCWWLTFAPITYAHLPAPLVYFFLFCASSVVGVFPGIFAALLAAAFRRFGAYGVLAAPFFWTFTELLRMLLTGNNWNALGYSQAFGSSLKPLAAFGGVLLVGFACAAFNACYALPILKRSRKLGFAAAVPLLALGALIVVRDSAEPPVGRPVAVVVAVQPNVPMDGLTLEKYERLLRRHVELADEAAKEADALRRDPKWTGAEDAAPLPSVVVFPESPMIFQYGRDPELQEFLRDFAARRGASVLFNSAETMPADARRVMNSAVMIDARGEKTSQYDKIHLVPFGEYIPLPEPLASQMPAFVGNFQSGDEYDLLPFGDAKGGVMICFESHFGSLSREYARRGADVLVEMTNDGYLGRTPILRQHLANSIFRAVETNRPLLRVTNVGITAHIDGRGTVSDPAEVYAEATRVWPVMKSAAGPTLYVRFGEWFAWLCMGVSLAVLFLSFRKRYGDTK